MKAAGLDPSTLDAILITHEHTDHIYGVPALSKKYKVPVFTNLHTSKQIPKCFHIERVESGEEFWIGDMLLKSFSIVHDAVDPVGYTIQTEGVKFAQATDLGRVTTVVQENLKSAHALVLESNHDQEMLRNCSYPWELKKRISSAHGHLSNETAAYLLAQLMHTDLCHVVLGHLSENSNTPDCALQTHRKIIGEESPFSLTCGSVHQESIVFEVGWGSTIKQVA